MSRPASWAPTHDDLAPYVAQGLVSRVEQGPIAIYNYTERCTYSHGWDDVTMRARGLVLAADGTVVARAFDKFFNHGEQAPVLPPDDVPDVVTIKHDGSLGIGYRLDGRMRWTTRGSFYSTQAACAEALWAAKYAHVEVPDALTPLVEIIDPGTKNIVRYDFADLVLLGVRNRHTGADLAYEAVADWAAVWGMPVTERVSGGLAEIVDRASRMSHTEEGFVVRWGDFRAKVKSTEYLRVARLIQGLTERAIADLWYAGRVDLLAPLPEEHRDYAAVEMAKLDTEADDRAVELAALLAGVAGITDRKAFVEAVGTSHPLFSAAMSAFSGKAPDVRLVVYRQRHDSRPRSVGEALS